MIVLDGVYTINKFGGAKFHPVSGPKTAELKTLLDRIIKRVIRRLEHDGLFILDEEQLSLGFDFDEPIDSVSAASTETSDRRYRIAIGPHSGRRTLTLHDPTLVRTDKPVKALTADRGGFSLNAAVACQHYQRERLERLCLGVPAGMSRDRLSVLND